MLTHVFFPKNIEEIECLIDKIKIDFDVIRICESTIMKNKSPINDINDYKVNK